MAYEFPDTPVSRGFPPLPNGEPTGKTSDDLVRRVRENLRLIAETRLREDVTIPELEDSLRILQQSLSLVLLDERRLRVERVRLMAERDVLRSRVMELRKKRIEKESQLSEAKARFKELEERAMREGVDEIERLEKMAVDLAGDVEALEEALRVHRRDKRAVLELLFDAQDELQDCLTEAILYRIQELETRGESEKDKGLAGLVAEILGRLLVLEKNGARIRGILGKTISGGYPDSILDL